MQVFDAVIPLPRILPLADQQRANHNASAINAGTSSTARSTEGW
jgi:hypothetical protein